MLPECVEMVGTTTGLVPLVSIGDENGDVPSPLPLSWQPPRCSFCGSTNEAPNNYLRSNRPSNAPFCDQWAGRPPQQRKNSSRKCRVSTSLTRARKRRNGNRHLCTRTTLKSTFAGRSHIRTHQCHCQRGLLICGNTGSVQVITVTEGRQQADIFTTTHSSLPVFFP